MQRGLVFLAMGILGSSLGMAELGKSLADLKILKNLTVVRETLLYNRTFVLAVAEDKATTGRQAQYLFLSGECLQIRFFSGAKPWTEERAREVWKEEFGSLPSLKTEGENLIVFDGANGEGVS